MAILAQLFDLGRILLAFSILYFWLPSRIIRFNNTDENWMDKIFISFIASNLVVIILVHVLAFLHIYETISLVVGMVFLIVGIYQYRKLRAYLSNAECKSDLVWVFDFSDACSGQHMNFLRGKFLGWLRRFRHNLRWTLHHIIVVPFDGAVLFVLLGYAAYQLFYHSFAHYYYVYSDPYVHLAWMKYLGTNRIYADGIYPYGYEAVLSAVNKIFFVDPASLIRFAGPMASCMTLFSIYFFLKKTVKNNIITFVALLIYIVSTELPTNLLRQRAALPQEYAVIFSLPGIYYLNKFYITKRHRYLVVASSVLAITLLVHLYVAVFVAVGYICVSLVYAHKFFDWKFLRKTTAYMSVAGLVGILPMLIGLLMGMSFHSTSIEFVRKNVISENAVRWYEQIFNYTEQNAALFLIVACSVAVIVIGVVLLIVRKKETTRLYIGVSLLALFLYSQYRAPQLGIPPIVEHSRVGAFCAMVGVVVYGLFMSFFNLIPIHRFGKGAIHIVIGVYLFSVLFIPSNLPVYKNYQLEYDQAARAYYQIKKEYPALNWTIVSPIEQFSYSAGYGWHYNLWEFVAKVVSFPSDEFVFTTDYVFFFVEKTPLNVSKPVTIEDAQKPFPDIKYGYAEYYTNLQKRRVIQAKAYFWLEQYLDETDAISIYYEDEHYKVYKLTQDGTNPINLVAQ